MRCRLLNRFRGLGFDIHDDGYFLQRLVLPHILNLCTGLRRSTKRSLSAHDTSSIKD